MARNTNNNSTAGANSAKQEQKRPEDMTIKELKALITAKREKNGEKAAQENGEAKLAKLRTYAIKLRAWADNKTAQAIKAEDKACDIESKLRKYQAKIGVEAFTAEEVEKELFELRAAGKIKQVKSEDIVSTEPEEEEVTEEEIAEDAA